MILQLFSPVSRAHLWLRRQMHVLPKVWSLACLGLLFFAGNAAANTLSFDGSDVAGCSYTSSTKTYACASLQLVNWNDNVVIASGYAVNVASAVTFGFNQGLTMSGTAALTTNGDLNIGGISNSLLNVSGGSLNASGGTFTVGTVSQSLSANIAGATVVLGSGSQLGLTGSVTSTGPVKISSNATINAPISGTVITTVSACTINGNVNASVSFALASGSTVTGNVTAPTVTVNPSGATINGNVTASNSVDIGSSGSINGNVVTGTLTTQPTNATVSGDVTANTVVLGYGDKVTGTIYCQAPVGNAQCSCVTNNSGTPIGSTGGPTCTNTGGGTGNTCLAAGTLTVSVPNHYAANQQNVTLEATKKASGSNNCAPAFSGSTKTFTFSCRYISPNSGTSPVVVTDSGTASSVSLACCAAASCSGKTLAVSVFTPTNSTKSTANKLQLSYADAGKVELDASYIGSGAEAGLNMSDTSTFIAAPTSFSFTLIKQTVTSGTAIPNPSPPASTATGSKFIGAGEQFSATISALNAASAVTPNFGKESPAQSAALSPKQVLPGAPGVIGVLNYSTPLVFSASPATLGIATATDLTWSEVGITSIDATVITPSDSKVSGYMGDSTLKPSGNSKNIGRFVPSYFTTSVSAMPCPSGLNNCSGPSAATSQFAYSQQAFTVTVTAVNAAGITTTNYSHDAVDSAPTPASFAKNVTLSSAIAPGGIPTVTANGTLTASSLGYGSFSSGVATTPLLNYNFANRPTTPTNIFIRAIDGEASSQNGPTTQASPSDPIVAEGGVTIVSGRLLVSNNYGSELLPMPIRVQAQYWNDKLYMPSNTDSFSSFPTSAVSFWNCKKKPATSSLCNTTLKVMSPAQITLVKGLGTFKLAAPGASNTGSVDVSVSSQASPTVQYLPYLPSIMGRAMFGVYRSPVIFIREVY